MTRIPPRYLIACDFDGTLFHTFSPSPNGINVQKAYQLALDTIFGKGAGEWFFDLFGLQGRTPSEVIAQILNWDERKLNQAYRFYETEEGKSGHLIPECKDGQLAWDYDRPETTITQMLVGQKLKYLLNEVGQSDGNGKLWPQPCKGVLGFFRVIQQLKKGGIPIDVAIISSGHEVFIRNVLDLWRIPYPDIIVTEDDIRPKKLPSEPERKFKPGQLPLALAHQQWLKQQNLLRGNVNLIELGQESKQRIMYVGDDPRKDTLMALRGRIPSHYLYPYTPWRAISETLLENKHLMDGRPLSKILRRDPAKRETDILLPDNLPPGYHAAGGKERF